MTTPTSILNALRIAWNPCPGSSAMMAVTNR